MKFQMDTKLTKRVEDIQNDMVVVVVVVPKGIAYFHAMKRHGEEHYKTMPSPSQ